MKKVLFPVFLIFVFFYPARFYDYPQLGKPLTDQQVLKQIKEPFITVSGKSLLMRGAETKSFPFSEYVEPGAKGYFAFYDKMGDAIDLYFQGNLLHSWKNRYNYPRIHYPFIFLFSSDLSRVELYLLTQPQKTLSVLETEDMISCSAASENGKYAIFGDLQGNYHIYNRETGKWQTRSLQESRINYVKGVQISASGDYTVLGSLYPEILFLGNTEDSRHKIYQLPSTGRSQKKILHLPSFIVIEKDGGAFIFNRNRKKLYQHQVSEDYRFYDAREIQKGDLKFLVLLLRKGTETRADFFLNHLYLYSAFIESPSLPGFYQNRDKTLILWENGGLEL